MADGIRVNMSDEEAKSEDRSPLPAGQFHYKFTDFAIAFVKDTKGNGEPNKNAGKPYINFELTVQDGQYAGRKDWTNAMCFDGALYTIAQILKALGYEGLTIDERTGKAKSGELIIPDTAEFYIGKDIMGRRGTAKNDRNEDGSPRIQLRGFSKYTGQSSEVAKTPGAQVTAKQTAKAGSVLP